MSEADTTALIEAVAADLATGATKEKHDEERLLKVEAQTHALAEAVIAMAATAPAVDIAVQAVKDEMEPIILSSDQILDEKLPS